MEDKIPNFLNEKKLPIGNNENNRRFRRTKFKVNGIAEMMQLSFEAALIVNEKVRVVA